MAQLAVLLMPEKPIEEWWPVEMGWQKGKPVGKLWQLRDSITQGLWPNKAMENSPFVDDLLIDLFNMAIFDRDMDIFVDN